MKPVLSTVYIYILGSKYVYTCGHCKSFYLSFCCSQSVAAGSVCKQLLPPPSNVCALYLRLCALGRAVHSAVKSGGIGELLIIKIIRVEKFSTDKKGCCSSVVQYMVHNVWTVEPRGRVCGYFCYLYTYAYILVSCMPDCNFRCKSNT